MEQHRLQAEEKRNFLYSVRLSPPLSFFKGPPRGDDKIGDIGKFMWTNEQLPRNRVSCKTGCNRAEVSNALSRSVFCNFLGRKISQLLHDSMYIHRQVVRCLAMGPCLTFCCVSQSVLQGVVGLGSYRRLHKSLISIKHLPNSF